jgi:prephenate dehydratase
MAEATARAAANSDVAARLGNENMAAISRKTAARHHGMAWPERQICALADGSDD